MMKRDRTPAGFTRKEIAWMVVGTICIAVAANTPDAHSDPLPCATAGVCQYMPNPSYNGPLMPTQDTPGVYGGWTNGQVQCNTGSYTCSTVETEQGDE